MLILLAGTQKAVQVMASSTVVRREKCIILDAGHGEPDGGAISCTGTPESEINLEIALKLESLFRFMGYKTKMTRNTDASIYTQGETIAQKKISDLKERVRIVNNTPGGVLLSIHQNTFTDEQYRGAQVFYAGTTGSNQLAEALQNRLVAELMPESSRKSKQSKGIYLMEHIQCQGVLIECGFISNPQEDALLRDEYYQKKLCGIIATTVCAFLTEA